MKFVKDTTWAEVFEGWRKREASDPGWIHCATVIKGWPDWESWRKFTASQIGAAELAWQVFEFTDPANEIPAMLIGPYTGWQSGFANKNQSTFEDRLNIPAQFEYFSRHEKVASIMKNFPLDTELIGLVREDSGRIVCIEGHHRAMAVALAKRLGPKISFGGGVRIVLAKLKDPAVLDRTLARGSTKEKIV